MQYENLPDVINKSISSLINNLLVSVDNNVFSVLDKLAFIDSSDLKNNIFSSFFVKSFSMVTLCQSLLWGILIYYAISYLISFFTCTNFQKPLSFLTKFFISAIFIHFSSDICGYIIDLFSLLTDILRQLGVSIFSRELSFSLIYERISSLFMSDLTSPFSLFSFDGILKSFISFGFINLLFIYSIRFIFIKILILISPFAFLSLSLDQSQWIFKIWLKNFVGQLFVQIFISIILLIIFSFSNYPNPTITKLLYIAAMVCLIKASSFVKDFTSGFTSDISTNLSGIKSLFQ